MNNGNNSNGATPPTLQLDQLEELIPLILTSTHPDPLRPLWEHLEAKLPDPLHTRAAGA